MGWLKRGALTISLATFMTLSFGLSNVNAENVKTGSIENRVSNNIEDITITNPCIRNSFRETRKIKYVPDPEGQDKWKSLEEIKDTMEGDCEEFAFYLSDKLKNDCKINNRVVGGYTDMENIKMVKKVKIGHAWVEYTLNGIKWILDPAKNKIIRRDILNKRYYVEEKKSFRRKLSEYNKKNGL